MLLPRNVIEEIISCHCSTRLHDQSAYDRVSAVVNSHMRKVAGSLAVRNLMVADSPNDNSPDGEVTEDALLQDLESLSAPLDGGSRVSLEDIRQCLKRARR